MSNCKDGSCGTQESQVDPEQRIAELEQQNAKIRQVNADMNATWRQEHYQQKQANLFLILAPFIFVAMALGLMFTKVW